MTETVSAGPYNPQAVEEPLYRDWLRRGYFKPEAVKSDRPPFVITMPPPNVTGELHNGHALFVALEDALIRWHRMLGEPTLWVPGRDHAGIAAQLVVERLLAAEGKSRHDLGRDKFLERMWDWMDQYGEVIQLQLRRLGASADWDREKFTMDPGPSRAVRTAFVRLYEKGLIYRGRRITNWCPRCQTALSDLEVEHREVSGTLTYVRYPLVSKPDDAEQLYVTVATTRPETILADTGVAVHPGDERYRALVGRMAIVPHVRREIPIVADEAVDPKFGTGAVKVTPGHDPVDFEIGARTGLPVLIGMNLDGTMNEQTGAYSGMQILEARATLIEELQREGLLVKQEPHTHAVGHCQRCGTVVEPIVSLQWYVKIAPLAGPALEAVHDGRIQLVPERFTKVYYNWMENIRDWCISRQLWWGHRIPVWYCQGCGEQTVALDDPAACAHCGSNAIEQDPDVLDTWFSSALWPFSTLGWPESSRDLVRFYPTTVMETGYDILFFWVARMIMQGLEFMGEVPFRQVFLHGMIRVDGQKMSKVKGNVQDPLELIKSYGADALRLALVTGTTPGNDINLSDTKLEDARNFVNKLWNASRFVKTTLTTSPPETAAGAPFDQLRSSGEGGARELLPNRWIRSRAQATIQEVDGLLADFQLGEAVRVIRDFVWSEYCDWYLEIAKVLLREGDDSTRRETLTTLRATLLIALRLLHPFAPFVTDQIWRGLRPEGAPESIMVAAWPTIDGTERSIGRDMDDLRDIVVAVRRVRSEYRVEQAHRVAATVEAGNRRALFESEAGWIASLARIDPLVIETELNEPPPQSLTVVAGGVRIFVPVEGLFDLDAELGRLSDERDELLKQLERIRALLAKPAFVDRAKPEVVARERERLADLERRRQLVVERLGELEDLRG